MIYQHLDFVHPPHDAVLWRYLSLWKFEWLLENQKLYMPPASIMDDPFEGAFPEENSQGTFDDARKIWHAHRAAMFLSCWHVSDHESDAMWKLYVPDRGIAIRTTTLRLIASLRLERRPLFLGKVSYLNYDRTGDRIEAPYGYTTFMPFLFKRRAFSHEQEARIIAWEHGVTPNEDGICPIEAQLNPPTSIEACTVTEVLIDAVVLKPRTSPKDEDVVRELLRPWKLENRLRRSGLESQPS